MSAEQEKAWESLFQTVEELNELLRARGDSFDALEAYCDSRVRLTATNRWVVDYESIERDIRADQRDDVADQWLSSKTKAWKSKNLAPRPLGPTSRWQAEREDDGTLTFVIPE